MAKVAINESTLTDIGNAIRAKTGGSALIDPVDMADEIEAIPSGATLVTKNITENGTYTASSDNADGYSSVTVDVPPSGKFDKSVKPKQIKVLVNITPEKAHCYILFVQTVANDVVVDFGDGSPAETSASTGSGRGNCATIEHTYSSESYGLNMITLTADVGDLSFATGSSGLLLFCGALGSVNSNHYPNNYYTDSIIGLYIGNNINGNLLLPIGVGIQEIEGLRNGDNIGAGESIALSHWTFRDGITILPNFMTARGVINIKIPSTITNIPTNALRGCVNLHTVDFTDIVLINNELPITFGSNVFMASTSYLNLLFATQEIAEVAKTTTNLTPYANYIHYVGE